MYSTNSNLAFSLKSSTSDSSSSIGTYLKDKLPSQPSKIINNQKFPEGLSYGNYMYWNNDKWDIASDKISLGLDSGKISQNLNTIAIGTQSAEIDQGEYSISLGFQSGQYQQGKYNIAIGPQAAQQSQNDYSISIGFQAGHIGQSNECVAIGAQSGQNNQGRGCVSIGFISGQNHQSTGSVAIGLGSGYEFQGGQCVAVGLGAGAYAQSNRGVSIGYFSGFEKQGENSVAIGPGSAYDNQGTNAVAIGNQSGHINQGVNAIAIGNQSGKNNQGENSIIINASGQETTCQPGTFNVKPIRQTEELRQTGILFWNSETSEIQSINATKTFVINHPTQQNKYLVHACLEGPEAGVYYRGKSEIVNNSFIDVYLPSYVESLASEFTIHLTPINSPSVLYTSEIEKCELTNQLKFKVYSNNLNSSNNIKFYWVVYGKRKEIIVEPNKNEVRVKGYGPYKWI